MTKPLVSIVIPTYNREAYIARAISSVQNQSFHDLEIIVADDGSKDNTKELISSLSAQDNRIRYIKNPINSGAQSARNLGIKAALGEWIAFQDSDDEWLPDSLECRLNEAERLKVKIVHSECYIRYSSTNQQSLFGIRPLAGNIYREILKSPGPVFPALLVHTSALKHINYLDESIVSFQEWETCIRLAKEFEFGFVEKPTFIYHRHDDISISYSNTLSVKGYQQIVDKHKAEIINQVGRRSLGRHYSVIANLYAKDRKNNKIKLSEKYFILAMMNNPSPKQVYSYLKSLLNQ